MYGQLLVFLIYLFVQNIFYGDYYLFTTLRDVPTSLMQAIKFSFTVFLFKFKLRHELLGWPELLFLGA